MTTIYLMDIITGSSPNCVEDERPTNWQSKRQRKGVQVLEKVDQADQFHHHQSALLLRAFLAPAAEIR